LQYAYEKKQPSHAIEHCGSAERRHINYYILALIVTSKAKTRFFPAFSGKIAAMNAVDLRRKNAASRIAHLPSRSEAPAFYKLVKFFAIV